MPGVLQDILRTPDDRFENLYEWPFEPHYLNVPYDARMVRMHYVDGGPKDAAVILCLHGQGTWAYMYRRMIPLFVAAGFRVVAPDYIGFGRSDKLPREEDYSFQAHVDSIVYFLNKMALKNVTAFMFDWGGFFGLRIAGERPELFDRLVLSNTHLPHGPRGGTDWFIKWREGVLSAPKFPMGDLVNSGTVNKLSTEIIAGYDAPFPDEKYKTGPRRCPMILPISEDDPASPANKKAWQALSAFDKPVLTLFAEMTAKTSMSPTPLQQHIPGAKGQKHAILPDSSFYIVEDKAAELAQLTIDFARR